MEKALFRYLKKGKLTLATETYFGMKLSQVCECQEGFTGNTMMAVRLALEGMLNPYKRSIL